MHLTSIIDGNCISAHAHVHNLLSILQLHKNFINSQSPVLIISDSMSQASSDSLSGTASDPMSGCSSDSLSRASQDLEQQVIVIVKSRTVMSVARMYLQPLISLRCMQLAWSLTTASVCNSTSLTRSACPFCSVKHITAYARLP